MIDWLRLAEDLVTSPWLYLVLILVSLLDSFLPAIPSEPVIVVAGVYAASGETMLLPVIAATALGAFVGDMVPYGLGRLMAQRVLKRLPPGTKRRKAHDWLGSELDTRAAYVIITSRFIPVGRYLVTLTAGMTRLAWPKFAGYTAISCVAWSTYTVLAGYVGGTLFRDNTFVGIGVGIGLAILMSAAIEGTRYLRRRSTSQRLPQDSAGLRHERQGRLSEQGSDGVLHGDQPVEGPQRHHEDVDETVAVEVHVFQPLEFHSSDAQCQCDRVSALRAGEGIAKVDGVRDAEEHAEDLGDGLPA